MNITNKVIAALFCVILQCCVCKGAGWTGGVDLEIDSIGFVYNSDGENTVTAVRCLPRTSITGELNLDQFDVVVTRVYDYAFTSTAITSVSASNVVKIGLYAFSDCRSLKSVSLPRVREIVSQAFAGCDAITEISLPGATTVSSGAFKDCSSLVSVSLPSATLLWDGLFRGCDKLETVYLTYGNIRAIERDNLWLRDEARIVWLGPPRMSKEEAESVNYEVKAEYEVKQTSVSKTLRQGSMIVDLDEYVQTCAYYNLKPKSEPPDPELPQIVPVGSVAVSKEALEAAEVSALEVKDGKAYLSVSIHSNGDFTTTPSSWSKINLVAGDVAIRDGEIVITVPTKAQQGFMMLKSKNGSLPE